MTAVQRVLVVGGGIGGLSTTIGLRRAGYHVDLVERNQAVENVLVPRPWHRGRVVLIGDAAPIDPVATRTEVTVAAMAPF